MKTVKEKLELLDKEIVKLQCDLEVITSEFQVAKIQQKIDFLEELKKDISVLGKFLGWYLVGSYDEDKNVIRLELPCNSKDVVEIENYVNTLMDDFYDLKTKVQEDTTNDR